MSCYSAILSVPVYAWHFLKLNGAGFSSGLSILPTLRPRSEGHTTGRREFLNLSEVRTQEKQPGIRSQNNQQKVRPFLIRWSSRWIPKILIEKESNSML